MKIQKAELIKRLSEEKINIENLSPILPRSLKKKKAKFAQRESNWALINLSTNLLIGTDYHAYEKKN